MSKLVIVVVSLALALTVAYDSIYDDYDYEGMLKNVRLMDSLVECLLSDGECGNPIFQEIKSKFLIISTEVVNSSM